MLDPLAQILRVLRSSAVDGGSRLVHQRHIRMFVVVDQPITVPGEDGANVAHRSNLPFTNSHRVQDSSVVNHRLATFQPEQICLFQSRRPCFDCVCPRHLAVSEGVEMLLDVGDAAFGWAREVVGVVTVF